MKIRGPILLLLFIFVASQTLAQEIPISAGSVDNNGRIQIQVESSSANYYGLFVRPGHQADEEWLVSLTPGQDGSTTLTEPLAAFPEEKSTGSP